MASRSGAPPPPDDLAAWWPPTAAKAAALGAAVRTHVNRLVFQIDAEQEARMRAYLDETYGDRAPEAHGERPIQMDALRCVPAARPRKALAWGPGVATGVSDGG